MEGRNKDHALICELKAWWAGESRSRFAPHDSSPQTVGDHCECSVLQYVDAGTGMLRSGECLVARP